MRKALSYHHYSELILRPDLISKATRLAYQNHSRETNWNFVANATNDGYWLITKCAVVVE